MWTRRVRHPGRKTETPTTPSPGRTHRECRPGGEGQSARFRPVVHRPHLCEGGQSVELRPTTHRPTCTREDTLQDCGSLRTNPPARERAVYRIAAHCVPTHVYEGGHSTGFRCDTHRPHLREGGQSAGFRPTAYRPTRAREGSLRDCNPLRTDPPARGRRGVHRRNRVPQTWEEGCGGTPEEGVRSGPVVEESVAGIVEKYFFFVIDCPRGGSPGFTATGLTDA